MKKILLTLFTSLFLIACSSETEESINTIVINSIESSKQLAFTDETITLNINATGFSNLNLTTNANNVTISAIDNTTYTVNTTEAKDIRINLTFTKDDFTETATIDLSFFEHGVINYHTVEGIEIDVDTSDKLTSLLGEPNLMESNNDQTEMRWHYFDLGLRFEVINETNLVTEVRIYGDEFDRTVGDVVNTSGVYPYEIGNSLKISDLQLTTNTVFDTFGTAYETGVQSADNNLFFINYPDIDTVFFFFGSDINDTENKVIPYMNVY